MRTKLILISLVYLLGLIYLLLPTGSLPDLHHSVRSDEEGDTWQNPDQKGFYTSLTRGEVIKDIDSQKTLSMFGYQIHGYRLNYPPEDVFTLVRDQLKSNYLEEIVFPMRESVFINGWEPKKSPANAGRPEKDVSNLFFHGELYPAKVTLRPVTSSVFSRLLIWTLCFPAAYLVFISFKKTTNLYVRN